MKVLIIAPLHLDLPDQPDEVGRLASALNARLIQGTIHERDILAAIDDRNNYDGVWISSHATMEGILLSDNAILSIPALAQYLSIWRAKWIVINSCESYEFVDQLQRYYPVDIVAASVKSLEDRPAWRTAALIARALVDTSDIRMALLRASPGGASPHRFWPSPTEDSSEDDMNIEKALRNEIKQVHNDMLIICRDLETDYHDLATRVAVVTEKVGTIEKMFSAIHTEPAFSQGTLRGIMIGIVIICVWLFGIFAALLYWLL